MTVRTLASRALPGLVALGLGGSAGLGGCVWPMMSPENSLPRLVTLYGQALLPDDYVVAAESLPAPRTFRSRLSRLDGSVLAVGSITTDTGDFSVNVPVTALSASTTLYEVSLLDPSDQPVYRGLVRLSARTSETGLTLSAASTTVALAAQAFKRSGRDPSNWDPEALSQIASVKTSAQQYASQLARWSSQSRNVSPPSAPPEPSASAIASIIAVAAR
ncbi:hypothetical protein J7643_15350 [bacterium]|nr:hypothetical protein [bacterium]